MTTQGNLDVLLTAIDVELGPPDEWPEWPGGWPGEISTALIDAVFSARATYRTDSGSGVWARVKAWRDRSQTNGAVNGLSALANEINAVGPKAWADGFGNRQTSPGRRTTAPGGATKAAAVLECARALTAADPPIERAEDVNKDSRREVERILQTVPGVGCATSSYFVMLLGQPGVKLDRMVRRFINDTIGAGLNGGDVHELIGQAAGSLGVEVTHLDHAIWRHVRGS